MPKEIIMKHFFLPISPFFIVFLLLGAGCVPQTVSNLGSTPGGSETTSIASDDSVATNTAVTIQVGAWRLSFDLPEGWVMAANSPSFTTETGAPPLDLIPETDAETVYLQNTSKIVVFGGIAPPDYSEAKYQDEYIALITVSYLGGGGVIPPDAVDLGNGFFRVKVMDVATLDGVCYGCFDYEYYFAADSGAKYKFHVLRRDVTSDEIEEVILSAEE